MRYPRFNYGEMSPTHNCIAVFPLVDMNDTASNANKEDFLGEYLAIALVHGGLEGTIGPRDSEALFEMAGLQTPTNFNQKQAVKIGKLFNAEAILYGSFMKLPMVSSAPTKDVELLLGVDLYLVDLISNSITWIYTTRFYSREQQYLTELAKLASEISQSLLASGRDLRVNSKHSCWDKNKIITGLRLEAASFAKTPTAEVTAPVAAKPTTPEPGKPVKPAVVVPQLAGDAGVYLKQLSGGETLQLQGMYDGRSTILLEKSKSKVEALGKAMMALPPKTQFMLEGHVDESDNGADDFWVSAQQASKIRDSLTGSFPGLSGRLQISSKGGNNPIMPNINQKSREKNRRIQVTAILPKS